LCLCLAAFTMRRAILEHNNLAVAHLDRTGLHCFPQAFCLAKVNVTEPFLLVDLASGDGAEPFKCSLQELFRDTLRWVGMF